MAIITSTSFKGTTLEALAASPADIKASTKVTITDNTYTAANLITILGKTNNHPVILEKTAAGIPLSANSADLVTIIEGVNKYTGSLTANNPATAEQLNIIAKGTTGQVTATLDTTTTINAATVTALKDVKATDAITFVTTETDIVGKSDLEAFVALNKKISNPDWTTIANFKGTESELSAIKSALGIKKTAAVEITSGQISAADANALSKAGGALTATLKSATVKATLSALKDIKATDLLNFTTTETTVNASDLVALEAKLVLGTQDYTSITTITETAAAVAKDVTTVTGALGIAAANTDVKISGNISATDAATIAAVAAAAGTGTLTATIFPGAAKNLGDALSAVTGALTLILTDETVVAGDLDALTAVTTVAINANSVKTITADAADVAKVSDVYDAAALKQISGLGNEIISIDGDISAAAANTLAGLTSGKVVAVVTDATAAALLAALDKADAKDELTLTVDTTSTAASDLLALDGKTSIAVNASAATLITGTAADVKKVFAATGIETAPNVPVKLSGTVSAADANIIAKATTGAVEATVATGTAAALNKALTDTNVNAYTLKISKGTAAAKDLNDLDDKTSVNVKAEDVTLITGTFAEVNAALTALTIDTANDVAATLSGTVSAANANTIAGATTGKVTATVAAADAATLNGALTDAVFPTGGNAYTLTVNNAAGNAAAATVLNALDDKTSVKVKVDAVEVSGDYADLEKVYVTNKAGFANLGDEKVEITDAGGVTADKVNVIAKATKGVVKATVAANTADVLVANLKDANATDALGLTVNGTDAKASDLNALDGKTSVKVAVDATNVTGNIADLTKLYITNADNFASLGGETVTISGTVTAAQADSIADETTGAVTANIAAATAASLTAALSDGVAVNAYKLTVNGATAAATDLNDLDDKTSEVIKVDAKEITGLQSALVDIFVNNKDEFTGEEKVAVKITDTDVAAGLADAIADKTSGVVTATITAADAATLNGALVDAGKQVNAYKLTVTGAAAAAHLNDLDKKTSVVVDAKAVTGITGSAADIKTVLAAKTITTAAAVNATVADVISAADANTISKATTGTVTATVTAATAAALKSALAGVSNDNNDALTLKVSGATATAADLNALDAKTSVDVDATAVSKITGNAADVKKAVDAVNAEINLDAAVAIDVSGTVSVADANTIAAATTGVVTATIAAGTATTLKTLLDGTVNAYKLTVSGNDADAADLNILDGKTSVTVNAAAITNIEGTGLTGAAAVKAAYDANANKTISGLGNETVNLSGATDASVSLVKAINDYTTGVITLKTLETTAGNFSLSQLGDLKGITKLDTIDAGVGSIATNMTISLKDLLAANDDTNSFDFTILGDASDSITFTDTTTNGWTLTSGGTTAAGNSIYTNDVTSQVIEITHTNIVINA